MSFWWMGGIVGLSEVRDQTKSISISSSFDLLVVTQFSGVIFSQWSSFSLLSFLPVPSI